jgi:hypothetical protein
MKDSERLYDNALKAIDELASDTSCKAEETLQWLLDLRTELDVKIEAIEEDLDGQLGNDDD